MRAPRFLVSLGAVAILGLALFACGGDPEPAGAPAAGACEDDGNECTDDGRDDAGECSHAPVAGGTPCADGTCGGGVCLSGADLFSKTFHAEAPTTGNPTAIVATGLVADPSGSALVSWVINGHDDLGGVAHNDEDLVTRVEPSGAVGWASGLAGADKEYDEPYFAQAIGVDSEGATRVLSNAYQSTVCATEQEYLGLSGQSYIFSRFDAAGKLREQRCLAAGADYGAGLVDPAGHVFMAFQGYANDVETRFVHAWDTDGTELFRVPIDLYPSSVAATPGGGVVVGGRLLSFGSSMPTPAKVVALDAGGAAFLEHQLTSPAPSVPSGVPVLVAVSASGTIAIATGTDVTELEPTGAERWTLPATAAPRAIAFDPAGNLIVLGEAPGVAVDSASRLQKIDPAGVVVYERTWDHPADYSGTQRAVSADAAGTWVAISWDDVAGSYALLARLAP